MSNIVDKIKNSNLPIIIFGARVVGEAIYYSCEELDLEVECFCDNNDNILDKKVCNTDVINAKSLKGKYQDAIFIISSTYINDIVNQLKDYGFNHWYSAKTFLDNFDFYKYKYTQEIEFVDFSIRTCLISHNNFLDTQTLYVRSVDLIITEKCSLKCKDCCNLIQYYEEPKDSSLEDIYSSIDILCSYVDEINEFRIIGGDSFMNKNWHLVVDKLIAKSNVNKIVIYANGIIIPTDKQIKYLQHKKVLTIFTNYGDLSKNLEPIVKLFDKNKISYHIINIETGWMDAGKIKKHNRTDEELKDTFRFCCVKNYTTLADGKIYRCPFHANAFKLQAVPNEKSEYIDIFELHSLKTPTKDVKDILRKFLFEKELFKTCDYCNGREYGVPENIQPAIQTKEPLEYIKYEK